MIAADGLPHPEPVRLPTGSRVVLKLRRIGLAVAPIVAVAVVLWWDRDRRSDNAHPDRPLGFVDLFFVTVVSLTIVGHGDIAPLTTEARLCPDPVVNPALLRLLRPGRRGGRAFVPAASHRSLQVVHQEERRKPERSGWREAGCEQAAE